MLKAQAHDVPVYTYFNSHVPTCQWTASIKPALLPLVGATHTSELPYVFGNGDPVPGGNCSFNADEKAISENLIAAWSAMASTGNPSVQGGLQWPQWNNHTSMGINIVNATKVGVVDYWQCAFWDMIDNTVLNFTSSSGDEMGGNSTSADGNGTSAGGKKSGAERRVELGIWGLSLAIGFAFSVLFA